MGREIPILFVSYLGGNKNFSERKEIQSERKEIQREKKKEIREK